MAQCCSKQLPLRSITSSLRTSGAVQLCCHIHKVSNCARSLAASSLHPTQCCHAQHLSAADALLLPAAVYSGCCVCSGAVGSSGLAPAAQANHLLGGLHCTAPRRQVWQQLMVPAKAAAAGVAAVAVQQIPSAAVAYQRSWMMISLGTATLGTAGAVYACGAAPQYSCVYGCSCRSSSSSRWRQL